MTAETHRRVRPVTPILLRQDFVGGLVVIAVAVFAFWQGADLPVGTLGGMGPGMLPRALAVLLGLLGALLCRRRGAGSGAAARTLVDPRAPLRARRGGGVRRSPCVRSGCVVAGPLAIVIGAFASDEVRWGETLVVRRGHDGVLHRPVQVRARAADPARAVAARLLRAHDVRSDRQSRARLRHRAVADQSRAVLPRLPGRHADRRASRRRPDRDHRDADAAHLQGRSRPARSSCWPASTTARSTAARPRRSWSTSRARRPRW